MTTPNDILDFWFSTDHGEDLDAWTRQVMTWFNGGMDAAIVERFVPTLEAAARGELDHWVATPEGRLALILVLDQFPRSIYRDSPEAYALDGRALNLALEGLDNGDYATLSAPWQKVFFTMPLGHAEGADHLERIDRVIALADELAETAPTALEPLWEVNRHQPRRARAVIARFGRHPHRNAVLGRDSTPEEQAYIDEGKFPHASPTPAMRALAARVSA